MKRPALHSRLLCTALTGLLGWHFGALGQPAASGIALLNSLRLQEKITEAERRQAPSFVSGQLLQGRPDLDLVIQGEARLRRSGLTLSAQRIEFDQSQNTLQAIGQVRIVREGSVFEGPHLILQADSMQGQFVGPSYQ